MSNDAVQAIVITSKQAVQGTNVTLYQQCSCTSHIRSVVIKVLLSSDQGTPCLRGQAEGQSQALTVGSTWPRSSLLLGSD